jgi:hypothetical protein
MVTSLAEVQFMASNVPAEDVQAAPDVRAASFLPAFARTRLPFQAF